MDDRRTKAENMAEVYVAAGEGLNVQCSMVSVQWITPLTSLFAHTDKFTYDPYTFPDNVTTAASAFANGLYRLQMEFTLDGMSDLRIGLRNFTPSVYDWSCVDNFRLIYIDDIHTGIEELSVNGQGLMVNGSSPIYDLSGRRISVSSVLPRGLYITNRKKVMVK